MYNSETVNKKTRKRLFLYLTYAATVFLFTAISTLIVLSATGYEVKFGEKEITIEETGMVIISSKPSGTNIYVNGAKNSQKTSLIFSVKLDKIHEGKYTLRLEKEGFYTWEKEIEVFPEMVTWANYVLLFSKEPKIEQSIIAGNIKGSLVSENKKNTIFLSETKSGSSIYSLNNENGKYEKVFTTTSMPKKSRVKSIRLLEMSKDGKSLLLSAVVGKKVKSFYMDISSPGEKSINAISTIGLDHITFNDVANKEVFGIKSKGLYRLGLAANNMSNTLDADVVQAFSIDDQIFYIKDLSGKKSLWQMHSDTSDKKMICDDIPQGTEYDINISSKDKKIALLTDDKKLYLLEKKDSQYTPREIGSKVSDLEWAPDGTRLFFQTKKTVFVLDMDVDRTFEIKNEGNYKGLSWYDSRHLLAQKDKSAVIMDFDGTNVIDLGRAIDDSQVFSSQGTWDIFFFSPSAKKHQFVLNRYQPEF